MKPLANIVMQMNVRRAHKDTYSLELWGTSIKVCMLQMAGLQQHIIEHPQQVLDAMAVDKVHIIAGVLHSGLSVALQGALWSLVMVQWQYTAYCL